MTTIPDEFLCPITLTIMTDPVIGGDGRTYERSAITQWLSTHPNSPMTRQPMNVASLKPNYALRAAIERFSVASTGAPRPQEPQGDYYYAIQVHNQINSVVTPQQTAQSRKRNVLLTCFLCVLLVIIIIIIASKAV